MAKQLIPGTRGTVFYVDDPSIVTIIGLDTDHKAGEHPLYDERIKLALNESFVLNIMHYGNKEAVKLRKNGEVFEVVDGRNRVRAIREAKTRAEKAGEVPPKLKVEFERGNELQHIGTMISLNEHRRDHTPMMRARKASRIIAAGHSVQEVALMFGVTPQAVNQWQKIVELATPVQKAIDNGQIAAHSAVKLHKLSHEEQGEKLGELIKASGNKRPTGSQVGQKAASANGGAAPLKLTRRVAKKLLDDDNWLAGISEDAAAILRLLAGDQKAVKDIPGLSKQLKKLQGRSS